MIGQGQLLWVKAAEKADARSGSSLSVFEAYPVLIGASGMDSATGTASPKKIRVVNLLEQEIQEGDWVPVARSLYGHIVTVALQASPAIIHFQIESEYPPEETEQSDECADKVDSEESSKRAKVLSQSFGSKNIDEYVIVNDTEKWFYERSDEDLEGKTGYAVLMTTDSYGDEYSGADEGTWEIIWMDWFRNRINVTDVIFGDKSITISREIQSVWNHCTLEDEIIEGTDCVEEYYSGGDEEVPPDIEVEEP
jgi:hypothetical protein